MANDMTPDSRTIPFDPVAFFEGKTRAYGLFEDRNGRVRRKMTVDMHGVRCGDVLTLKEDFVYDDGATETRTWTLTRLQGNTFRGTTHDAHGEPVGTRTPGEARIAYDFNLKLPKSGRTVVVHFDDRMMQMSETLVVNRATVSKWGFRLGEVYLVMQKAA
ncbi:MAG: hypothetical protein RL291_549 [Pseudomonadota bacterium]|jgi:hypothetical protein